MRERGRHLADGATDWVVGSIPETGHRGLLLISLYDLGQDTNSSGHRDSQAQAIPGAREKRDCKSLAASRPSLGLNGGPLNTP